LIRWVLAIFVLLAVFYPLLPILDKFWVGRLPGDFRFRFRGIIFCFPFGSTFIWSVAGILVATIVRIL
jgi:hypothetical protein